MSHAEFILGLQRDYAGRKVLVTGASGFLGKHVCALLKEIGACPVAAIHSTKMIGLDCVSLDLNSQESVTAALHSVTPDFVIHLAASLNRTQNQEAETETRQLNELGTARLLNAIQTIPTVKRPRSLLLAGTADVYGPNPSPCTEDRPLQPLNSYGRSKLKAWQLALESQLPCVEARIFMLYGEGQSKRSFIGDLVDAIETGREFAMSPGEQTRDFIWAQDAAEAIVHLGRTASLYRQSVNLCTGQEHSLKDSVLIAETILGREIAKNIGAFPYRQQECFRLVGNPEKLNNSGYACKSSFQFGLTQLLRNSRRTQ